jgi:hypothetical protein
MIIKKSVNYFWSRKDVRLEMSPNKLLIFLMVELSTKKVLILNGLFFKVPRMLIHEHIELFFFIKFT